MSIDVIYDNSTKVNVFNLGLVSTIIIIIMELGCLLPFFVLKTMHSDVNVWINTEPSTKQNLSANFTLIKSVLHSFTQGDCYIICLYI